MVLGVNPVGQHQLARLVQAQGDQPAKQEQPEGKDSPVCPGDSGRAPDPPDQGEEGKDRQQQQDGCG